LCATKGERASAKLSTLERKSASQRSLTLLLVLMLISRAPLSQTAPLTQCKHSAPFVLRTMREGLFNVGFSADLTLYASALL